MENSFQCLYYSKLLKQVAPLFGICKRTAVNLSYKIIGKGSSEPDEPPVLILHSLLGSKKRWEGLGKTIMNMTKRSVITIDLRNHGDSPHVNSHKYEDLSSDVLHLYERMGIERASIVGHGMGGRAAMYTSLKVPDKVAGILLVDVSPVSTPAQFREHFPDVMTAMKAVEFKGAINETKAIKLAKRQLKKLITDDVLMTTVLSNVRIKEDGSIGWACNLDVLLKHFKHIIRFPKNVKNKKYFGPTYFIGGQLSEYLPPDDLNNIRAMFPKAVISYIPKTGHYVHIEDPKTFMEITIAFLRTNQSPSLLESTEE